MSRGGDFLTGLAEGTVSGVDENKRQKQALLLELLKGGQYQVSPNQAPQGNFMSRVGQNIMGPNLNGSNANLMGMNLDRVTPDIQAANLKRTLEAYKPMMGDGGGSMKPSLEIGPDGQPKMSFKSVDPMTKELQAGRLQSMKDASAARKDSGKLRESKFYQTEWDKLQKDVNPTNATSRSVLGTVGRANLSADRALKTLMNPVVTNQEAGNVMADIASIYQGGSPTQFGMQEQGYRTVQGQLAGALQFFKGNPQDAVPPAIKQRLIGVLNDMKQTNKQILQKQINLTERAKRNIIAKFPDEWNDTKSMLLGDDSGDGKTGKQLDANTAMQFLQQVGGDKDKARELAKQNGYSA